MKKPDFLTATDFFKYIQCPHWPYWDRFGDKGDRRPQTETEIQRLNDGLEHEREVVKDVYGALQTVRIASPRDGFRRTLELMKDGAPVIYQGWLLHDDWLGRPDILERREGKSNLGAWYYAPVDVKRSHELKKEHKAQLTFYSLLLERIQGRFPGEAAILNADHERIAFAPEEFMTEFKELADKLERIRGGEMPEPVYRKACHDTSPWGEACFRLAYERNDIALLFNVDLRKLKSLRDAGIRTVADAAELSVEDLEGHGYGLTARGLLAVKRQARALRDQTVIVKEPFKEPTPAVEIHFDIESHPPTDTDYLYGFWIRDGKGARYHAFVAESPEDEACLWRSFLAWLPTLPADYAVYHYASYEPSRLAILAKRYGTVGNPWLERFRSRLVDLKERTRDSAVFPLYFYSLKKIGQFLGFAWEGDVKGGGESVIAYEKWLKTKRRKILDSIIQYNEEDVRATAFLLDWLRTYAKEAGEYAEPYPWIRDVKREE